MNRPSRSSVGVIFKGHSVSQLDAIIAAEPKPDGSDMTFSDAARLAIAAYYAGMPRGGKGLACLEPGCGVKAAAGSDYCGMHQSKTGQLARSTHVGEGKLG
jgi:hypothetical protein